jgi:histidinol-phosphate aminotransferase
MGLMKVKDSYNVNTLSQAAAVEALRDETYVQNNIKTIVSTRKWFAAELIKRKWKVVTSCANFILVKPPSGFAKEIAGDLENAGYLVRYFSTPRLNDKIRISIGTDEQMKGLLKNL